MTQRDPYCFNLRLPASFEGYVKAAADKEGVSINQFLVSCVSLRVAQVLEMHPPYKFDSFIPSVQSYPIPIPSHCLGCKYNGVACGPSGAWKGPPTGPCKDGDKFEPQEERCPVQSGDHVLHKPSKTTGTVKTVNAKRDREGHNMDEALIYVDRGWHKPHNNQTQYWMRPGDKPDLFWVRVFDLEPQKCSICGKVSGRCDHTHVRPRVGDVVAYIDDPSNPGTIMGFTENKPYPEYLVQWKDRTVWVPAPDIRVIHRPLAYRSDPT